MGSAIQRCSQKSYPDSGDCIVERERKCYDSNLNPIINTQCENNGLGKIDCKRILKFYHFILIGYFNHHTLTSIWTDFPSINFLMDFLSESLCSVFFCEIRCKQTLVSTDLDLIFIL